MVEAGAGDGASPVPVEICRIRMLRACQNSLRAGRNVYLHEELRFSGMFSCIFLQMLAFHSCPKKRKKNERPGIVEISTFNFLTFFL